MQAVKYCFTTHKKNKKPKTCEDSGDGHSARKKREAITVEAIGATGNCATFAEVAFRPL